MIIYRLFYSLYSVPLLPYLHVQIAVLIFSIDNQWITTVEVLRNPGTEKVAASFHSLFSLQRKNIDSPCLNFCIFQSNPTGLTRICYTGSQPFFKQQPAGILFCQSNPYRPKIILYISVIGKIQYQLLQATVCLKFQLLGLYCSFQQIYP